MKAGGWEGGGEKKGTKITRVSFSSLNTMQHVIVEMALVPGNSVLQEKRLHYV